MRLLLDTHALLWSLDGDKRLGPTARSLIADRANDVLVSVGSLWEVAIKVQAGKLNINIATIADRVGQNGATLLGVTVAHLATLTTLPRRHRDPFDHLLIAQAITEGATLMSEDGKMQDYPVPLLQPSV